MWKAALLLSMALAITACGKTSPLAPSTTNDERIERSDNAPRGGVLDAPDTNRRIRNSDDHVEPPGVLPPG